MNTQQFIIDILDLYWINGTKDDPNDLCLHGEVFVKIGEEIIADRYSCTVSSTGLYLLKSLNQNHIIGESTNQMLPCCGFFIIPSDDDDTVEITGCSSGVDWSILHEENYIKLISQSGNEVTVDLESYKEVVFKFVDKIEEFYHSCQDKNIPKDKFERNGYIKFWKEWYIRRNEHNN